MSVPNKHEYSYLAILTDGTFVMVDSMNLWEYATFSVYSYILFMKENKYLPFV